MQFGRLRVLRVRLLALALAVSAGQLPLLAQADTAGTATIAGTVVDQSGTPIPQAAVAVKNEASGAVRSATTESDGRFTVGNLPAGTYAVDVSANGFSVDRRTGLKLTSGATMTLPISMQVANVSQSITVEAALTLAVEAAPSQ